MIAEYWRGFSYAELTRMIKFAQLFPEESILVTLSQQLRSSYFHGLLKEATHKEFLSVRHGGNLQVNRIRVRGDRLLIKQCLSQGDI